MKMVYERPMMSAEQFVTNAYCGPCIKDPVFNTKYSTPGLDDPNTHWFNPAAGMNSNINDKIAALGSSFSVEHTFSGDAGFTKRPSWVSSNPNGNQYYWTCDCPDCGGTYFLEYSLEWADEYPDKNVFVLYKDDNGNGRLDIEWTNGGNLPNDGEGLLTHYDYAIGAVSVNVSKDLVSNIS